MRPLSGALDEIRIYDNHLNSDQIKSYLKKVDDVKLYAYGVYQIEDGGKNLFSKIEGDEDTIMGLPIKKIKEYLNNL